MKVPATAQKLRGAYYTPRPIADFLAQWAIHPATTSILEPSCGDGSLLEAAAKVLLQFGSHTSEIQGVEIDEAEAQKAETRFAQLGNAISLQIHNGDFFTYCQERLLW